MYYDNSRVTPNPSRKRPRSNDDDNNKNMPTSKKFSDTESRAIFPETSSSSTDSVPDMHAQFQAPANATNVAMLNVQNPVEETQVPGPLYNYRPELSLAQNPFYYHVNGILYEAHMQRLNRSSNGGG